MGCDLQQLSEAEVANLVKSFIASGDKKYWGQIYEEYKKNIFIQCFKILNNEEEAKDLTSDVFIKAIEKILLYDTARPLLPWLCGIAKNLCIDNIRKKQRIQFIRIENESEIETVEDETEGDESKIITEKVRDAIEKLKHPQRLCFCLFYMHEKSYNEIVKLTGYTYDEVRSHIQNGRRKFKIIMNR